RNVIAGNQQDGIVVQGSGHVIVDNLIGTNAVDAAGLGNGANGIRVQAASGITIGGSTTPEINVISGNGGGGHRPRPASSSCVVTGNRIGTNWAGMAALPNQQDGVQVDGSGHTIGGTFNVTGNVIAANLGNGLRITGYGHTVAGNYIGVNVALGAIGNG